MYMDRVQAEECVRPDRLPANSCSLQIPVENLKQPQQRARGEAVLMPR